MKFLFKIIKKLSLSFGILYGYNLLMQSFNLPIPINIITLAIVFFLGIHALFLILEYSCLDIPDLFLNSLSLK